MRLLVALIISAVIVSGSIAVAAQNIRPTPDLDAESREARSELLQSGVRGVIVDDLRDLGETYPQALALPNASSSRSLNISTPLYIEEAYESGGKLFVVTDDSPAMGFHDYHLAIVSRAGLTAVPLSRQHLVTFDVYEKSAQAMVISLNEVRTDAPAREWMISNGTVRPVHEHVNYDDVAESNFVYTKKSACVGPNSGVASTPLSLRQSGSTRVIRPYQIAAVTRGVSTQVGVREYCRSYLGGALLWLTDGPFGVTVLYSGEGLKPFFGHAPEFVTEHYLIFREIVERGNETVNIYNLLETP